jgi:hypothetical protein
MLGLSGSDDVSLATTTLCFNGISFAITEVSYKPQVDRKKKPGNSRVIKGFTKGQFTVEEAKITMPQAEFNKLLLTMGVGYLDQSFSVNIIYANSLATRNDILFPCKMKSHKDGGKDDGEVLVTEIDLDVTFAIINNLIPITLSLDLIRVLGI